MKNKIMKNGTDKEIRYYIWDNDLQKRWCGYDDNGEYYSLTKLLQEWALCKPEDEWGEWYNDDEGNYLGDNYRFEDYVKTLSNEYIMEELNACCYEVRQIIDIKYDTPSMHELKELINK
tara:strand:+ start:288 stop:644 length:357 start_codon:yes stop_codon:yes gene_type:complete